MDSSMWVASGRFWDVYGSWRARTVGELGGHVVGDSLRV